MQQQHWRTSRDHPLFRGVKVSFWQQFSAPLSHEKLINAKGFEIQLSLLAAASRSCQKLLPVRCHKVSLCFGYPCCRLLFAKTFSVAVSAGGGTGWSTLFGSLVKRWNIEIFPSFNYDNMICGRVLKLILTLTLCNGEGCIKYTALAG